MNEINLFLAKDGSWVTNKSMIETLLSIEADKCDTLFIHTSLSYISEETSTSLFPLLLPGEFILHDYDLADLCS